MAKIVSFKLDEETLRRLDRLALIRGVSRSELLREAVEKLLEESMRVYSDAFKPKVVRVRG